MSSNDKEDDQRQPSHLRLISENANVARSKVEAKSHKQAEWTAAALRRLAATLLRVMAGGLMEAEYFIRDLSQFMNEYERLNVVSGSGFSAGEIEVALRLPRTSLEFPYPTDWEYRATLRNVGMEEIVRGSLRLAAHQLLGERPHFGGKHSKDLILSGIRTLDEANRSTPEELNIPRNIEEKFSAQEPGPYPLKVTRKRKSRRFGQNELKELRKAIKENDTARIAELTAKIGQIDPD